jgi:Domain of unknown function (DUF4279)
LKDQIFTEFDDEYPTCQETYATLCIYLPDNSDPNLVSRDLGIIPSRTQIKGEISNGRVRLWPTAWFYSTQGLLDSKDIRRHLCWILEKVIDQKRTIFRLQDEGSTMVVSCMWVSALGHGGPELPPEILGQLVELRLGVSFDIYGGENNWEIGGH